MGKRENALQRLLIGAGLVARQKPPAPRLPTMGEGARGMTHAVFGLLDGVAGNHTFAPGCWDMAFDGVVVELDEEQHFNRFRARSLEVYGSDSLPWCETYRSYCMRYEEECLGKAGRRGYWHNESSGRMFGPSGSPLDLHNGASSARWKQRALYDSMKDAHALHGGNVRLARVSVYDHVDGVRLDAILDGCAQPDPNSLLELVRKRIVRTAAPDDDHPALGQDADGVHGG